MKVNIDDFRVSCGCRSVGECDHERNVEAMALDSLIDKFAIAMKTRLTEKLYKGWTGWDDVQFTPNDIRERISNNLYGTDPAQDTVDIANLAAFWWNRLD